jgi:hypothetical protein
LYGVHYAIEVAVDIVIPKTQHPITAILQSCIPFGISICLSGMLASIDLNNQFARRTSKVSDVMTDRMLPAYFPGKSHLSQRMPQTALGIR